MKKYLIKVIIIFTGIIFFASCKEQVNPYLSYRKVDSLNLLSIHSAYLRLRADSDSVVYTSLHYAELKGHFFDISDSINILYIGHCFSQTNQHPTLLDNEAYTQLSPSDFTIDTLNKEINFMSKINTLEVDVNYYCRSYAIVENKRTGVKDTGYNQTVIEFATRAQDIWFHRANFSDYNGVDRTEATAFTMNNKAYILTGYNGATLLKDFWRYNPEDSTWTQLGNFPGVARMSAVAFVIGDTAYVGTGIIEVQHHITTRDFWKWTEEGLPYNSWRQIDSLGENQERCNAVAFTLNVDGKQRGYIGLGEASTEGHYRNDFYYYRPDLDTVGAPSGRAWVQTDAFIGGQRTEAVASVIENLAIVGSGKTSDGSIKNDFFVFNPDANNGSHWSGLVVKNDPPPARTNAVSITLSFERNGSSHFYFYFGTGKTAEDSLLNDWWRYDYINKEWKRVSDIREDDDFADPREGAVAFTLYRPVVPYGVHTRGFVATGNTKYKVHKDVWEYLP